MWIKVKETGTRLLLLLGLLFLITGYFYYVYEDVLPDKISKEFKPTRCLIMSKKLSAHGVFLQRYRADFLISYNVNGVQYNRWVSGNGFDSAFTLNKSEQRDLLTQFKIGEAYTCYFNPKKPELSLLILRHKFFTFLLKHPTVLV